MHAALAAPSAGVRPTGADAAPPEMTSALKAGAGVSGAVMAPTPHPHAAHHMTMPTHMAQANRSGKHLLGFAIL